MNNVLGKGGHLSSQPMGALFNYIEIDPATGKENVVNFPVRADNPYKIDVARMLQLIDEHRPELLVFGKSMFISPEPVREAAAAIAQLDPKPVIMFDMAHVLGLYGAFQQPLHEGADIVTGSTHKTFFGPQRGVIVSNIEKGTPLAKLWPEIRSRAFPGSTSNHHLGTLLALLVATQEMNAFKQEYQQQVRRNAKAFAAALVKHGVHVEGDPADGYTDTHQVLLRVIMHGSGEDIAERLERSNIIVNYQALPDDESFLQSSGIRTGVQEMTRFGMTEQHVDTVAGYIADVILHGANVAEEVKRFRQDFLEMKYCMPEHEALEFGAQALAMMLPTSGHIQRFADHLIAAARMLP